MKSDVRKVVQICAVVLILAIGTAHAAKNLVRVRAGVDDTFAFRGGAVFTECLFENDSFFNTVETTISAFVQFPDGSELLVFEPETSLFGPRDARILRGAVIVDVDMTLGTGLWVCRAESTIVGGPRPTSQSSVDVDVAAFGVFDRAED